MFCYLILIIMLRRDNHVFMITQLVTIGPRPETYSSGQLLHYDFLMPCIIDTVLWLHPSSDSSMVVM